MRKKSRLQIDLEVASRGLLLQQSEDPLAEAEKLYRKFRHTKKESVRAAVSIRGFFMEKGVSPEEKEIYGEYIRAHILPIAGELVEEENITAFSTLEEKGWISKEDLDQLIEMASDWKKTGMLVHLMHIKNEAYGFSDDDFSI